MNRLKTNFNLKLSSLIISGLVLVSGSALDGSSLPVPLGPPQKISPVAANPDKILQNLIPVMDNHYQLPWYPGGAPDYLSQIYYMSNFSIANILNVNPCNDSIMHVSLGQNFILDLTGTFLSSIGSSSFATSTNRGRTWKYGPPIEQIRPLGGLTGQIVNTSLGPGTYNTYGKNGKLYASGFGYFDMIANPPNTEPQSGFLFTTSTDNGENWKTPKINLASNKDYWYLPSNIGLVPREFYFAPDKSNPDLLYGSSMFVLSPIQSYGALFANLSTNGGKTFTPLKQVYLMIDDPTWRARYFDPNETDPTYYAYGGFPLSSGFPTQIDSNIIMLPVDRLLPPFFPIVGDQAAVRSLDNGKTWLQVAGATETYTTASFIFDPGFINPFAGQIIKGQQAFGLWADTTGQWAFPLVSPSTGRVYLTYGAFNDALSDYTTGACVTEVRLSVSADKGATFMPVYKVNRTPTNILTGAQQAFSHGAAITSDGYYVVAYYDFRNWTGSPGENVETNPLQTDVWLAVYKEVEDPQGGSTGVGLDFVGEMRLTPESWDARIIARTTPNPYIAPYITGTPEGIQMEVNNNNELFVLYSKLSEEDVSLANITTDYKGMTIDRNGYVNILLQRLKFPNSSDQ